MKYRRNREIEGMEIVRYRYRNRRVSNFAQSYSSVQTSGSNSTEKQVTNVSKSEGNLDSFRKERREEKINKVINNKLKERDKYKNIKAPIMPKSLKENIKNKKESDNMSPLI